MYRDLKVGIAVPAYNEEKLIGKVIETMPEFVDLIVVVDDCSKDSTSEIAESYLKEMGARLVVIQHAKNTGVGGAVTTAYKYAYKHGMDVVAVMAGDAQMDPDQLTRLLDPIIENKADYTKGNRLLSRENNKLPQTRQKGNAILTILTKFASGYWDIIDPQNGYTAASNEVITTLVNEKIYPRYGYCNDILVKLNIHKFRVMDIVMPPVYGEEVSEIKLRSYTPKISILLTKLFFQRINRKYGGLNFHPLFLFYYLSLILLPIGILLGFYVLYFRIITGSYSIGTITLDALIPLLGLQLLLFAFLFDEMEGKNLTRKSIQNKEKNLKFFKRMKNEHYEFVTTGFFRPEDFYRFGFKIERKYAGLVKKLSEEVAERVSI